VLGWVLGVVGIAPQVLAFGDAPFFVAQTLLASGLLILLFIGSRPASDDGRASEHGCQTFLPILLEPFFLR
jgi:hypothetical protein